MILARPGSAEWRHAAAIDLSVATVSIPSCVSDRLHRDLPNHVGSKSAEAVSNSLGYSDVRSIELASKSATKRMRSMVMVLGGPRSLSTRARRVRCALLRGT